MDPMVKKIFITICIPLLVLLGFVLLVKTIPTRNDIVLLEEDAATRRASSEIANQTVHYLDSEAVALADTSGDTAMLRSEALRAFNLVNEERERGGLEPLAWDPNLEGPSDVRARECEQSFSHTRPNGTPWYTVNSDIMGGENLAYGYDDASSVLQAWMDSPTHRENILFPDFTKMSISIYRGDDNTCYWAQEFGY